MCISRVAVIVIVHFFSSV